MPRPLQSANPKVTFPQVNFLLEHFDDYLKVFDEDCPFKGDQVSLHRATIDLVRAVQKPIDVLESDEWFRLLRATLKAWGMARRGAHLRPIDEIRKSFLTNQSLVAAIQEARLEKITTYGLFPYERAVLELIDKLEVGTQEMKLIVNSKALHHLIPDLVPPIDRRYTLTFFFLRPADQFQHSQQRAYFKQIWPALHLLAVEGASKVTRRDGMYTSVPKIVDNAIIGFIKKHLGKEASNQN